MDARGYSKRMLLQVWVWVAAVLGRGGRVALGVPDGLQSLYMEGVSDGLEAAQTWTGDTVERMVGVCSRRGWMAVKQAS